MTRVACIDIGTVTCRLALADVAGGRVVRMAKQTTICDLGEGLDAAGRISDAARDRVLACVDAYLVAARSAAVPVASCTLTSAARDAENSDELLDGLAARGLKPEVIPGEVEGRLTFLGVAQDFAGQAILIVDNGGGSTELALGALADGVVDIAYVHSVDVGCRRITERYLAEHEDGVPTEEELAAAHAWAAEQLAPTIAKVRATGVVPSQLIACGGTVTTLVALDAQLVPYDSAFVHLHELTLDTVERLEAELAARSVDARAVLPGIQAKRAGVILGGTVIIAELLRATGFDALTVSESDLLFGLSLSAAAAYEGAEPPIGWRPTLASL